MAKHIVELNLNHLKNQKTINKKEIVKEIISEKEYENTLNILKNEFQKTIKEIFQKNQLPLTVTNKHKQYSITFTKKDIVLINNDSNKTTYHYKFNSKELTLNKSTTETPEFLTFYKLVTDIIHDISKNMTQIKQK